MVLGSQHQPDAPVAERAEMTVRLAHRDRVVRRDRGEPDALDRRVHQHRRKPSLPQSPVVFVVGVGLRVQSPGEDHARHVLVQQHVHIVGLGDTLFGSGAEHRREAPLRERAGDHFGEGGKNGVAELG